MNNHFVTKIDDNYITKREQLAHLDSSIPLDSAIEDKVLPLSPLLPILKLEKSKFEETRFPLQPTQAGGPNKIQNPTSLHSGNVIVASHDWARAVSSNQQ